MKATQFEFRFRIAIIFLLYFLGFLAPWERYSGRSTAVSTAWLELTGMLASTHWLTLNAASLTVTSLAVLLAFAGAMFRVWGAAYIGTAAVYNSSMQTEQMVAAGPYRHVRNPLYLGLFVYSAAVAILMPPTGAIFFLVAMFIFELRLILGEESHLASQLGEPYLAYCRHVPRLAPSLMPRVPASQDVPRWLESVVGEICAIGVALSFGILAWRYNAQLLTQAVIICFGLSLVVRAILPGQKNEEGERTPTRTPSS